MNTALILGTALSAVGTNKLRTALTLLGIIIGVSSVITLMAIGRGSQDAITSQIESLGTNILFVSPSLTSDGSSNSFTLEDVAALENKEIAPDVSAVAAEFSTSGTFVAGRNETTAQVVGVTSNYFDVRDFGIAEGRGLNTADVVIGTDVVVLGSQIAPTLFGNVSAVGQTVKIDGREFEVIGVLEPKSGFGLENNRAMMPITTAAARVAGGASGIDTSVSQISVQAASTDRIDLAFDQIRLALTLENESGFDPEDAGFDVTNQADAVETLEATNETFVVFLGAIAGISLVVGGIGIMNIMLVSVTERTREIGIQRAIGATKKVILSQFVAEATIMSIGGGLIGVIVGTTISFLVDGTSIGSLDMNTEFAPDIAILALAVSAVIGLGAGIYPAFRAAALDPIEALRHE
ncbi:MAG: FtsX-like permease family protein [Chloroflexi bacterium]|nr:FtsX-like permease family protein [Chloroflexota bacterium]MBT4073096.1 FtsX-like permease family protein [Chloroflexota bacterium]MBT4514520.1 FtsX-like permease family protein [Chloroflexota bacterium]MBT6682317.1 FtsX-like permease family protein [Chloroflexota bacterium]